jgi:SAM-dependent methyltransferase
MSWRATQAESRRRYLAKFDAAEAERYDETTGRLDPDDQQAYLADLRRVWDLRPGTRVLDAGAGTGSLTSVLVRQAGLAITALEPAPAMLARLRSRPELRHIATVKGFCDAPGDRQWFDKSRFDVIVSRQLANGLYDPLAAFRNWHHWLAPGGAIVLIDGVYERASWTGAWAEEVDVLPLAACGSKAALPYLLEAAGLRVAVARWMDAVNARAITRTPRYVVVARKAS